MQSKSKSKSKSIKLQKVPKNHKNNLSNNLTRSTVQTKNLMAKNNHTNQKATDCSKYIKKDVIKHLQKEIQQIKVQIQQLKQQSNIANLTEQFTKEQHTHQSSEQGTFTERQKVSHFQSREDSKINEFQLYEEDKQNTYTQNLLTQNICNVVKEENFPKCQVSLYHQNRVKYRNLQQSNFYIDYYLIN